MNAHLYKNLTVINDSEIQSITAHIEERAVIARLPQSARDIIGHKDLKDVI